MNANVLQEMMKKWILMMFLAGGVALLGLSVLEYQTSTLPGELTRIESKGKSMVAHIEDFKRSRGQYPSSLGEAGIFNTNTRFGEWRYEVRTDQFSLTIGDYRHGFVFGYSTWAGWWWDR